MKHILKSALLGIVIMFSVNFVFGQSQDTNIGTEPTYDHMYITFANMGNLPTTGSVTITWYHNINQYHPSPWSNTKTFNYQGEGDPFYSDHPNYNPLNWIGFTVKVVLGHYTATKSWSGDNNHVTFTQDDFSSIWGSDDYGIGGGSFPD